MVSSYYPTYGYGAWSQLMATWQQYGVFTVLLPLVLVFAVVFAILERINLFRNKGVHLLIALVIGFFTISNPNVSFFFQAIFGNLVLGIVVLVVVIILLGLAVKPDTKSWTAIFGIVGGALLLVVLARPTFTGGPSPLRMLLGEGFWFWAQRNAPMLIIFIVLAVAIGAIVAAGKTEAGKTMKIPMGG